jgi:hypothetical protein
MSNTMTFEQFNNKYFDEEITDTNGNVVGTMIEAYANCGPDDHFTWDVEIEDEYGDLLETRVQEVTVDGKTTLVEVEQ